MKFFSKCFGMMLVAGVTLPVQAETVVKDCAWAGSSPCVTLGPIVRNEGSYLLIPSHKNGGKKVEYFSLRHYMMQKGNLVLKDEMNLSQLIGPIELKDAPGEHRYQLLVILKDGKEYLSDFRGINIPEKQPEKVKAVVEESKKPAVEQVIEKKIIVETVVKPTVEVEKTKVDIKKEELKVVPFLLTEARWNPTKWGSDTLFDRVRIELGGGVKIEYLGMYAGIGASYGSYSLQHAGIGDLFLGYGSSYVDLRTKQSIGGGKAGLLAQQDTQFKIKLPLQAGDIAFAPYIGVDVLSTFQGGLFQQTGGPVGGVNFKNKHIEANIFAGYQFLGTANIIRSPLFGTDLSYHF